MYCPADVYSNTLYVDNGKSAPVPSDIKKITAAETEFINLVLLDMDSYTEKYGDKAVRKNCTIPAWLNTAAEKNNVNFSAVLQDALIRKLNII